MKIQIFLIIITCLIFTSTTIAGDYGIISGDGLKVAGDLWITFRALERNVSPNANFHSDDPFDVIRVRTFLVKDWNPKTHMTVEFLWDEKAPPRVQGAYLTLKEVVGSLGLRIGKIPSPFGNYSTRSTYFNQNPLIGVPAMWHYRTPFNSNGSSTNSGLISRKSRINRGLPIGYDACWDYGIEGFYEKGIWEGALAGTQGTIGSMGAVDNLGYQVIAKAGMKPITGMRAGISVAMGPYIRPDTVAVQDSIDILDYNQKAVGLYWEYSVGYWQLFSEIMLSVYEPPRVKGGDPTNISGYFEARWNFAPGWYLAERLDIFQYNKIPANNDGSGPKEKWGYDFNRIEAAIGWRPIREGIIRLDYQGTYYDDSGMKPLHLLALQFGYAF